MSLVDESKTSDGTNSSIATVDKSSPSSFVSDSISSADSSYHRVAVLLCSGCRYLEFPGCAMHNGLLCNIKGNGYMSCVACELDRKAKGGADVPGGADNVFSMVCATDSAEPWSVACQHCNAVKADTIPWIIADSESVGLSASMAHEKEDVMPHTVIQCEQCKTSIFPLVNGRLTRRHPVDPTLAIFHPDEPTTPMTVDQFPFKHYVADCRGVLIQIPILISKLEGKFCGQALPQSPYLPIDSSFVPGFIPPLEWVTGEEHKKRLKQQEWRKEKYVLSTIGHRTPVWRDKAFIGVFGDPYVRDTELEGGHIAESIDAMHFVLEALWRSSGDATTTGLSLGDVSTLPLPFDFSTSSWFSTFPNTPARDALLKVVQTIKQSMDTIHQAKDALDALQDKDLKEDDKAQFTYRLIRNYRKKVRAMKVGDVMILPGGWIAPKAGHAIMHIIYRYSNSYSFVTCNTGGGLTFHPSSVSDDGAKMVFRTSVRIDDIPPQNMLDDAFWLVFWRLQTVASDDHDHHVLYEILLPTLSGKPLAESLVPNDPHAEWRTPQRAGNCFPESDHRVLTDHGFLFLGEIEELIRKKQPVRYASYDTQSKQIIYCEGELYIRADASHEIIEWTPGSDRSWSKDRSSLHPTKHATNHFSIRCTPDHQVFGRTGARTKNGSSVEWSSPVTKYKVGDLVTSDPHAEFQHLAVAEGGVQRETEVKLELLTELSHKLGLASAEEVDAFLELYGFWVGACAGEIHPSRSIVFAGRSLEQQQWLQSGFRNVGLAAADFTVSFSSNVEDRTYRIHSPRWIEYFAQTYSHDDASAMKGLFSWVLRSCNRRQLRLILAGMQRVSGSSLPGNEESLFVQSMHLRDGLMVMLLQAGFSSRFEQVFRQNMVGWNVYYSDPTSPLGQSLCHPTLNCSSDMRRTKYLGRVWCVQVNHLDHLIVAQRARRNDDGVVTQVSRPVIISNCYLKCVLECTRYLQRSFGMTKGQTKQSSFAVRRLWMNLCLTDLQAHARRLEKHPDSGDDKTRRKREAKRLQDEMLKEGVPEKQKKHDAAGVPPPNELARFKSSSTRSSVEEQATWGDLPLIDIPAETLNEDTTPLHDDSDLTMIRLATKQTAHVALKEAKAGRLNVTEMKKVYEEILHVEEVMQSLPIHVVTSSHIQPKLLMGAVEADTFSLDSPVAVDSSRKDVIGKSSARLATAPQPSPFLFAGFDTFPLSLEEETLQKLEFLAGKADPTYVRGQHDFRGVFRELRTLDDILYVFDAALQVCVGINAPQGDSLNGYYQVQALIQSVLTYIPLPGSTGERAQVWFSRPVLYMEQRNLVRTLWRLAKLYITAEFSLESPAFVSGFERTIVMWSLVTLTDWIMRRSPSDLPLASPVTRTMNGLDAEGGSFYLFDLHNGGGQHVRDMVSNMESSVSPDLSLLYGELVEYWSELETSAQLSGLKLKPILPWSNSASHQSGMFQEDDHTLNFVRDIAKAGEYIIEKRGYAGKESSEIEAVARWLFAAEEGDYSIGQASFGALVPQLARDHPEFANMRDLHFLFKLSLVHTHPTSRVVLPGRYTERDASIYWTTQGMPMSNSMVIIYAKAFQKKEILLIKSRAIESYATPDAYLPAAAKGSASNSMNGGGAGGLMGMFGLGGGGFAGGFGNSIMSLGSGMGGSAKAGEWSEEDVIHNTQPALFDNLLSLQSSEHLMCILTAPYLRIPLVLSFFANKDRVDLLADRKLGKLLSAVLFETGAWASRFHEEDIEDIPFSSGGGDSGAQQSQPQGMMAMFGEMRPAPSTASASSGESGVTSKKPRIGSPYGLLLNELCTSAGATLNPFIALIVHALSLDTGYFSVTSATCKLILYVAKIAVKMESFVRFTVTQISQGTLKSTSTINTQFLRQAHVNLLHLLLGPVMSVLLSYKNQSMSVISEAVWVMASIARVAACGLLTPGYAMELNPSSSIGSTLAAFPRHWHPLLAYSASSMVELLGAFSFVLTWHSMGIGIGKNLEEDESEGSWTKSSGPAGASGMDLMAQFAENMQQSMNASKLKKQKKEDAKEKERASKQPVEERALFQTLQACRSDILEWFDQLAKDDPSVLNGVFDSMVEWVHGHKMTDVDTSTESDSKQLTAPKSLNPQLSAKKPDLSLTGHSQWEPMRSSQGGKIQPGRFVSHIRRLEIDLQTASITFYEHDVFPVHDLVARHEDFIGVFGPEPQHYALIRSQEHRQEYGIFGSNYTLQWWDRNLAGECVNNPAPAKKASSMNVHQPASDESALPAGKWKCGGKGCAHINPFSAQRCELCKAYQPMLSAIEKFGLMYRGVPFTRRYGSTYLAPQETWIVEMLEPLLRTLFSDELDTLNYSLWMREQPWSESDEKVCLFALDAQTFKQIILYRSSKLLECYNLLEHGRLLFRSLVFTSNGRFSLAGLPTDDAPIRLKPWEQVDRFANGAWEEVQKRVMSFTLRRTRVLSHQVTVKEQFLSPPLLAGLLPKVLLEHYHFYLVEDVIRHSSGSADHLYPTLFGRHSSNSEFDWFSKGDILGFLQKPYRSLVQWNFDLHIKLVPNQNSAISHDEMKTDDSIDPFAWDQYHALISQITRGAAGSVANHSLSLTPGGSPSPSPSPSPIMSPEPSISPDASPSASPMLSPTAAAPFRSVLLNLLTAPPNSFLARLASVLVRIEDLSHVLVWSRTNESVDSMRDTRINGGGSVGMSGSHDESYRIIRIDLPRLKLSFRPRRVTLSDGSSVWRLFSNDHAGFFISDAYDEALDKLLSGIPNSLLLENDRRELWLLVPNTPVKRPQILSCPFSNELVADRANRIWLQTMDTRFYVYPVHVSHTFLLSNTLSSTFYLLLLALLSRNYTACAQYCETCEIDQALTSEEKFVFKLFEETLHDQHPDAHAIRLKLYVCIWLSGEPVPWKSLHGEPWSLEEEYSNYCKKLMHVSASCRLTNEEEEAIYQQISYEEGQKKDTAPNEQQNRAAIRHAIVKHFTHNPAALGSASSSSSSSSALVSASGDSPARSPCVFKPPKRDGLTTVWYKWQASLSQYLAGEWQPGVWSGMVCYERPSPTECSNIDLLDTIGDALNDTMIGSMHKKGFLFLLDAILGGITIKVDTTAADCEDCSFSLGRMLTQWHFLKTTKFGEEIKPQPNYLPFAVNAVFGSGFIPTRHNEKFRKPVYSIPSFPPLPQVPVAGLEVALSKGFLLHKQGTPVNAFFIMLSQWASGFVKMCSEYTSFVNRPSLSGEMMKSGYALLEEWPSGHPSNTGCQKREMEPFKDVQGCSLSADACEALVGNPLQSIDVSRFLVDSTSPITCLSSLPFDVSTHSAAQSYVAKSMLARMSHDMGEYAEQVSTTKNFQLKGVTSQDLSELARILDTERVDKAIANLNDLHQLLVNLRTNDWTIVQSLRTAVSTLANSVPDLAQGGSVQSLKFVLSRYAGQSFDVRLDFLTALLLSKQPEQDLKLLNPHLPPSSVPDLLRLVSTLLLVTNRVGFVDRLVFEVDELRGQLHSLARKVQSVRVTQPSTLARSLSGGTVLQSMDDTSPDHKLEQAAVELYELTQQVGVQSSTLADNLLAGRHYMSHSTTDPTHHVFDPRFLVFEYVFNIMLRRMQIDLIMSFAQAAWRGESTVQQMIMGAGKTSVVGPLLALMLADGVSLVTMVVPSALLPMSRAMLRARFSSIVPKRIHTFEYDRSTKDDPKHVAKLLYKMNQAKKKQGIVIATAVSVKSMMLKYLELLVALQTTNYDPHTLTPFENHQLATKSVVIDGLSQIMCMWREGTLILDEIDLLLHPLKSELNFPCGNKVSLQPAPNRWNYPMHLLDAFFYHDTGYLSVGAFHELPEAQVLLKQLHEALVDGHAKHMLQMLPHLIILNSNYFHSVLKPLLAKWSLIWLKAKGLASDIPDAILLEYMTSGWSSPDVSSLVTALLNKQQMVLLNLAYNWLNSYLLHVLSKINRVGYGLLREDEMAGAALSLSRRLCAVPFIAKDVPSRSSEFAHSEVLIGLTVLAYKIEGLRLSDLRHCVSVLKNALSQEMGPEHARPSARMFQAFVHEAKRLRKKHIDATNAMDASSKRPKGVRFSRVDPSDLKILPLSQFSLTDPSQLRSLYDLLRFLPSILDYYLNSYLFPTCLNHQLYNLSASGQELGNGMLFKVSLGFSGTPSDLLPLELGKCAYERGSDGKVLNILTSPAVVSYSIKYSWSVRSLLLDIARAKPAFHSLIDTGALITGLTNQEVAEFLLEHGLEEMEGVVFLDPHDNQMILLRTGGGPIPASQCGVAVHKRFSFYDQVHTTGIDIKHGQTISAVMTLGKDMTFRDYAQGAFRMRQIGQGQKIHLFIIPEVLKLIERELKLDVKEAAEGDSSSSATSVAPGRATNPVLNSALMSNLPVHVAAWLTLNSCRSEALQFFQLCLQNLHSVWRKKAFADLLLDSSTPSAPNIQARRHLRYDLAHADSHPRVYWLMECINLFKQPISFDIEDHIPVYKPFFASLKTLISQHTTFIKEDRQCLSIGTVLNQALEAAQEIIPKQSYDKEMINEQEREQEQEKHQEVLKDPRAQRNEEEHLAWKINKLRETDLLVPVESHNVASHDVLSTTGHHPFFPLAAFSLEGRPLPLSFPRYLLMSHNYYRQSWALNPKGHRRLKNIYVILEWCPPKTAASSVPAAGSSDAAPPVRKTIAPSPLTPEQSDRWTRLFRMLDSNNDGLLSTQQEIDALRRLIQVMLDEDLPATFLPAGASLTHDQVRHILQAVTKEQDVSKIAGFIDGGAASSSSANPVASLANQTENEEAERFFVIVPLSEAQALRRAVHTTNPLFRKETDVQFALWALDGHLIETTQFYQPTKRSSVQNVLSNYQVNLSLQTARFMNGELYFTEEELVSLLRGIGHIHPAHRRILVEQLLLCRHRDHRTISKTPLEKVIHFADETHWFFLQAMIVAFRARLDAKGLSLLQAFHLFDLDGNGLLDPSELWTGAHFLGLAGGSNSSLTGQDIVDFLRLADRGEDGALDFEEFTQALRTREETQDSHARVEQLESDSEERKEDDASILHHTTPVPSPLVLPKLQLVPMPPLPQAPRPPTYIAPTKPSSLPVAAARPVPAAAPPAAVSPWSVATAPAAVPTSQPRSPPAVATEPWNCAACTYANGAGRTRCEICDTPKQ